MGFFSWNCRGCGLSIRSAHSALDATSWMRRAVALSLQANGATAVVVGEYDGYGRISPDDQAEDIYEVDENPCLWHEACHRICGEPGDVVAFSERAEDQGYFVDCAQWGKPLNMAGVNNMRRYADLAAFGAATPQEPSARDVLIGPAPEPTGNAELDAAMVRIHYLEECMRRAGLASFMSRVRDPMEVAGHLHDVIKSYQIAAEPDPVDPWEDDGVQFARLLCEIRSTQDNLDYVALAAEMDLALDELDSLFDRAASAFDQATRLT